MAAPDDKSAPDAFWQSVEANLQRGRIRMLFVADRIPTELRRIVEFMNEQMKPAEVLAVEVKQYTSTDGDDLRTLVPTVIGQTAEAQQRKRTLPSAAGMSKLSSKHSRRTRIRKPYRSLEVYKTGRAAKDSAFGGEKASSAALSSRCWITTARPILPFLFGRQAASIHNFST